MSRPGATSVLQDGTIVCRYHGHAVCRKCWVDYSPQNDEDYINRILADMQVPALQPFESRFIPQTDRQTCNTSATLAAPPYILKRHGCFDCSLTWLVGWPGTKEASTQHHPYHDANPYADGLRSIFVHVDGACPSNGYNDAIAGIGVFFHQGSPFNLSERLVFPANEPPTNQRAEIYAVVRALESIREQVMQARRDILKFYLEENGTWRPEDWHTTFRFRVIIATDSSYVVECMCSHLQRWIWDEQSRTYSNLDNGHVVVNSKGISRIVEEVKALADVGVQVVYHHIPRELNFDADSLARAGALKPLPVPVVFHEVFSVH